MIQCIAKRLAEANIMILEDAQEDLNWLMSAHERLSQDVTLSPEERDWIEDRFYYYYKKMDT